MSIKVTNLRLTGCCAKNGIGLVSWCIFSVFLADAAAAATAAAVICWAFAIDWILSLRCALAFAFCCSSSKKFILNQLERRPNFEPPFDMPTEIHLVRRHALHVVRVFLLITHRLLFLHSGIDCDLLHARPKNDWK